MVNQIGRLIRAARAPSFPFSRPPPPAAAGEKVGYCRAFAAGVGGYSLPSARLQSCSLRSIASDAQAGRSPLSRAFLNAGTASLARLPIAPSTSHASP